MFLVCDISVFPSNFPVGCAKVHNLLRAHHRMAPQNGNRVPHVCSDRNRNTILRSASVFDLSQTGTEMSTLSTAAQCVLLMHKSFCAACLKFDYTNCMRLCGQPKTTARYCERVSNSRPFECGRIEVRHQLSLLDERETKSRTCSNTLQKTS